MKSYISPTIERYHQTSKSIVKGSPVMWPKEWTFPFSWPPGYPKDFPVYKVSLSVGDGTAEAILFDQDVEISKQFDGEMMEFAIFDAHCQPVSFNSGVRRAFVQIEEGRAKLDFSFTQKGTFLVACGVYGDKLNQTAEAVLTRF